MGRKLESIMVACDQCRKEFNVKPGMYRRRMEQSKRKVFYCSTECFGKSIKRRAKAMICDYCERLFVVPGGKVSTRLKQSKNHFCSRKCSSSYHTCGRKHSEMRKRWATVLDIRPTT